MIFENEIKLENKKMLEEYLNGTEHRTSGLSFTSLYMWRDSNVFSYEIINGYLCISGLSFLEEDIHEYFMFPPLSKTGEFEKESLRSCLMKAKEVFEGKGSRFILRLVPGAMKPILEEALPELSWTDDRANYDYLYNREEIQLLKGKRFHAKKNFVNSFKKNYTYTYEDIDSSMTAEIMEYLVAFYERKQLPEHEMDLLNLEMNSMEDVFEHFEEAGFYGGVIRIDGKICAMAAGGILGTDTIVEHIEKADTSYRGLYPAMLHEFAKHLPEEIRYINREEDMDVENLRKAKLSFRPCELIEKYIGELK